MANPTLDNTANVSNSGTTMTATMTVGSAGTNGYLLACVFDLNGPATSSVTWNGTSMFSLFSVTLGSTHSFEFFGIAAPAIGSHSCVATYGSSYSAGVLIVSSWYNVAQASVIDNSASNSNGGSVSSFSTTGTTSFVPDVIVDFVQGGGFMQSLVHTAGQTDLANSTISGPNIPFASSYKVSSSSGSQTMGWSLSSGSGSWYQAWVALKGIASASNHSLGLLGVGT